GDFALPGRRDRPGLAPRGEACLRAGTLREVVRARMQGQKQGLKASGRPPGRFLKEETMLRRALMVVIGVPVAGIGILMILLPNNKSDRFVGAATAAFREFTREVSSPAVKEIFQRPLVNELVEDIKAWMAGSSNGVPFASR